MKIWIALLYGASAVLPLLGLFRLYRKARTTSATVQGLPGGPDSVSLGQLTWMMKQGRADALGGAKSVLLDFVFIGVGVIAATTASIWALCIS